MKYITATNGNEPLVAVFLSTETNSKYYNQNTGETIWPPNDGAAGEVTTTVLPEGTRIDRYGLILVHTRHLKALRMK